MAQLNGVSVDQTVSHVCILGVTLYILYLCTSDFSIFTWHPILHGIGWMLMMTEAVLMVTKDNIYSARLTHALRIRYHWVMQVVAVGLSVAGFIFVFVYTEQENLPHFSNLHGLFGLISMAFCIPVCLNGTAALFNIELRKYISPKRNKLIHAVCGIMTVIMGGITMVLSLYTGWFNWRTQGNQDVFIFCYVAIVFGVFWSLVRPIITTVQRLK